VADATALDVAHYRAQRLARYATVIAEARSRSLRRTKAQPRDLPRRGGEVTLSTGSFSSARMGSH
jgi:hypothetical protein